MQEHPATNELDVTRQPARQGLAFIGCALSAMLGGVIYGHWMLPVIPGLLLGFFATIYTLSYFQHPTKQLPRHGPILILLFAGIGIPAYRAWISGWRGFWRGLGFVAFLIVCYSAGIILTALWDGQFWLEMDRELMTAPFE